MAENEDDTRNASEVTSDEIHNDSSLFHKTAEPSSHCLEEEPGLGNHDDDIPDQIDDSDDDVVQEKLPKGHFRFPPTKEEVEATLRQLQDILKPPRQDKSQSYKDPGLNKHTIKRLEAMVMFCRAYLERFPKEDGCRPNGNGDFHSHWMNSSLDVARLLVCAVEGSQNPGKKKAEQLRRWLHDFIDHEEILMIDWNNKGRSLIDDEDFAQEIHAHLQSLIAANKEICAEEIVKFTDNPEMLERLQRTRTISLTTAKAWLRKMGY